MTLADIDWLKMQGLVPAIIQDAASGAVLMLAYMNQEALALTERTGRVTFWSRSKGRLWTKGETSGHYLDVHSITVDCDGDSLLIMAHPTGPVCHLGTPTCWGASAPQADTQRLAFLTALERTVAQRLATRPAASYTAKLADQGILRIAQKVGEEGLELALAAVAQSEHEVVGEAADLLYHLVLLLNFKGLALARIADELQARDLAAG